MINTAEHDARSAMTLVRDMRETVGIEIPDSITDEIELYKGLSKSKESQTRDLQAAVSALYNVEPTEFEAARRHVIDVSLRGFAADEVDKLVVDAAAHRVRGRVFDVALSWQATVVDRFNQCVEDFRLNEVADDLPNFTDPGSFNVVSLSQAQGHAVDHWRNASVHLKELWSLFSRLVAERGDHILGPAGVEDLSTNLLLSCVLGDPGSIRVAEAAATRFASVAGGSNSVRAFGPLLPFVIPVVVGYPLRLHTMQQANLIRQRIQHVAA